MTDARPIRIAFLVSGIAGLVYEVLWSRYLGLFVGHGAYAQILVLAVYLGGMAVGSLAVSDVSRRLRRPLRWYAGAEVALGVFGLAFHPLFAFATDLSYDVLFPAIGSGSWVGSVRWAVAGILILPQAIVLGTTFPLMAAGLVRADEAHPGGRVAEAYLLNTLGGAAGVLLAGFVLIGAFGLPGTSVAAAVLNLVAAGLVLLGARGPVETVAPESAELEAERSDGGPEVAQAGYPVPAGAAVPTGAALSAVLLTVAFGTALASFAYEVGWIRMLSLLLGSATHAFELMLSAFILGMALGAGAIRRRSDATADPVRLLGGIQVAMGVTALLSLPVYLASFDVMAGLIRVFSERPDGYHGFNVGRYGLCLMVMLPSTVLAGMTLPVITGTLLRAGAGERTIGRVYGVNTLGSVAGAGLAGLVALPLLGLEGLVVAGAGLDVVLGLWLLERAGRWSGRGSRTALAAAAASVVLFASVSAGVEFDPNTVTSGVYRRGELEGDRWRSLFYQDGRTATVSAHIGTTDGVIVLATNGKPDASLGPRWILDRRDTLPELPIPQGRDFTTQVLAPMVALAHRPDARTVANIGHGSGMTASSFLTSRTLERLVTIEIEPLMVEGSLVFLPANGPAFGDPRVSYVFDDAKSYFSYRRERFDIVFAEPSNPWVSGTASLFTREFYERVTDFMTEGGVLAQWMQLYELNDDLFLSVLAALDAVFPTYRAYLIGDSDVAIVASLSEDLPEPDWSVVETDAFRALTTSAPPFLPQHMEALRMFDERTFRLVLDGPVAANSDYRPVLDLGAERARFEQTSAEGAYSFAVSRVDLGRWASGRPRLPEPYALPPAYGLASTVLSERGAWLRAALEEGGGIAPEPFPEWQDELVHLQRFLTMASGDVPLTGVAWISWTSAFVRAETALHQGTSGWVDPTFYGHAYDVLDEADAPEGARAVVDLLHGYALADWPRAAAAADLLLARAAVGELWIRADLLLDAAVLAYLETGQTEFAGTALDRLEPYTGRSEDDLRSRLLRASVEAARAGS